MSMIHSMILEKKKRKKKKKNKKKKQEKTGMILDEAVSDVRASSPLHVRSLLCYLQCPDEIV